MTANIVGQKQYIQQGTIMSNGGVVKIYLCVKVLEQIQTFQPYNMCNAGCLALEEQNIKKGKSSYKSGGV